VRQELVMASVERILHLGTGALGSTTMHRRAALLRLGHEVVAIDPLTLLPPRGKLWNRVHWLTGYRLLQTQLCVALASALGRLDFSPSLVWVDSGELLGPTILGLLRNIYGCPILLYCTDDPTGLRDWNKFTSLRAAASHYDLIVCCRDVNQSEWLALGAANVLRVWMGFDDFIHHLPQLINPPKHEVTFIGVNIPHEKRDSFLVQLLSAQVPITIHGPRWSRSPLWKTLKASCSQSFFCDTDYTALLARSAMNLGLLSHGNRDLHTTRSLEVTAASSVLLAERTSEHQLIYEDGIEALFWDTSQDCALVAQQMLGNSVALAGIRHFGHRRATELGVGNNDTCRHIIAVITSLK